MRSRPASLPAWQTTSWADAPTAPSTSGLPRRLRHDGGEAIQLFDGRGWRTQAATTNPLKQGAGRATAGLQNQSAVGAGRNRSALRPHRGGSAGLAVFVRRVRAPGWYRPARWPSDHGLFGRGAIELLQAPEHGGQIPVVQQACVFPQTNSMLPSSSMCPPSAVTIPPVWVTSLSASSLPTHGA